MKKLNLQLFASTYKSGKAIKKDDDPEFMNRGAWASSELTGYSGPVGGAGGHGVGTAGGYGSGYGGGDGYYYSGSGRTSSGGSGSGDYYSGSGYRPSSAVNSAKSKLDNVMAGKPSDFSSKYDPEITELYGKIKNRDKFSYDLGSDMLYQQYKEQYSALGKMAMEDTIGTASALTGGYGNSYATKAGAEAYNQHIERLGEIVPELYGMARDQYNREGEELYNQYGLVKDMRNTEYGEYRDRVSDYYNDLSFAQNNYQNERDFDFGTYKQGVAESQWREQFNADQEYRRWQQNFQEQQAREDAAYRAWEMEYKEKSAAQEQANWEYTQSQKARAGTGGGGGGSNSTAPEASAPVAIDPTNQKIFDTVDRIINTTPEDKDVRTAKNEIKKKINNSSLSAAEKKLALEYFNTFDYYK